MLTSKGRFYKNTYKTNKILMILGSGGRKINQKSIKNRSKIDQKSMKNRLKRFQKWSWRLSWGLWGLLGDHLGPKSSQEPSGGPKSISLDPLGVSRWGHVGAMLGLCWSYVGASWRQNGNQNAILSNTKLKMKKESPKMPNIAQHDPNLAQHGLHLRAGSAQKPKKTNGFLMFLLCWPNGI